MLKTRLHFNRVNMRRGLSQVWTAHNSRGCFQGDVIVVQDCNGREIMRTVYDPNGKQPRAYFSYEGRSITKRKRGHSAIMISEFLLYKQHVCAYHTDCASLEDICLRCGNHVQASPYFKDNEPLCNCSEEPQGMIYEGNRCQQ